MYRRGVFHRKPSNLLFQILSNANQIGQAEHQNAGKEAKACGILEVVSGGTCQVIVGTTFTGIIIHTTIPIRHGRISLSAICHRGKKLMTREHKVISRYFPDFKGEPVVLFAGNRAALKKLAEFLEALAGVYGGKGL